MMSRGAAPGVDGWTRELLGPIIAAAKGRELLACFFEALAGGRFAASADLRNILCASVLVPLQKSKEGKSKIRPVAMGSALIKLASRCTVMRSDTTAGLSPAQRGVGGNAELAANAVRELFNESAGDETVVVATDMSNAFNCLSRHAFASAVFAQPRLASIAPLVHMLYGAESPLLLYERGDLIRSLAARTGIRQGCFLGPLLFAHGMEIVHKAARDAGAIGTVMYLDDMFFRCAPEDISGIVNAIHAAASGLGLRFSSYSVYAPRELRRPEWLDGGTVLGAPMGFADFDAERACIIIARRHDTFFRRCEALHPFVGVRLLGLCGVPRMNSLTRTVPPTALLPAAEEFDELVRLCLSTLLEVPVASLLPDQLWSLPFRFGGLGVRPICRSLPFAFSSRFAKGEQRQKMAAAEKAIVSQLLPSVHRTCAAASAHAVNVQPWTDPLDARDLPSASAAAMALRARIGVGSGAEEICLCGAPFDPSLAEHALICHRFNRHTPHDAVVKVLALGFAEIGIVTSLDVGRLLYDSQQRPDLVATIDGKLHVIDVKVVHPAAKVYAATAAGLDPRVTPLVAAVAGEADKVRLYATFLPPPTLFAPFVAESFGGIGPASMRLLSFAAARHAPDAEVWLRRMKRRVAYAVWSGIHSMVQQRVLHHAMLAADAPQG